MTMRRRVFAAMALLCWLLSANPSYAQFFPTKPVPQQQQPGDESANSGQKPSAQPELQPAGPAQTNEMEQTSGAFRQRLFYIIPDFWAQNLDANIRPLSANQKFELFVRTTVDRSTLLGAAFSAGLDQASDSPPRYDQNLRGYGQRYGLVMAGTAISNGLKDAALPIVFRQDPRYFRLNRGGGLHRTLYAFSRVGVARNDSGKFTVNWSELLGSFGTAAITRSWAEEDDKSLADTMRRGSISIGYDAGLNLLKEFWPELKRRLGTGRKPSGQNSNPQNQATATPAKGGTAP